MVNRLNVRATSGDVTAQLRLDAFTLASLCRRDDDDHAVAEPGGDMLDAPGTGCVPIAIGRDGPYRGDFLLERFSVVANTGAWTLTGGDYFRQLGRGIVLAVRKVDEAGLDVTIQGALAERFTDDHRVQVFAGRVNPANLDAVNQRYVRPVDDVIAGYGYELRALQALRLSVFGAWVSVGDRVVPDQTRRDWTYSQGVAVSVPTAVDWLSFYIEGDVQMRRVGTLSLLGSAGYATLDLGLRDLSILVEGIALDDFRVTGSGNSALSGAPFRYNVVPTLERIDQETLNAPSVLGTRLLVEQYIISSDTTLYANGVVLVNHHRQSRELRQLHGYGGIKTRFQSGASRVELSGGYRDETQTNLAPIEREFGVLHPGHRRLKSMAHVELDYVQHLAGSTSLHLWAGAELRTLAERSTERGTLLLGVERSGLGGLTFEFGIDTQGAAVDARTRFYAAIGRAQLSRRFSLTAVGGTQRGGIRCINGICRDYPSFSGGRLELVSRF